MWKSFLVTLALMLPLYAQVGPRRAVVRASGEGVVSVRPDQVKVRISVNSIAKSAQEAAEANANETTKVMGALRQGLGTGAELRTVGYSLGPWYNSELRRNDGFIASNSLEVTISDLALAGRAIDIAASAGVTSIGGVSFGLKDPQPARLQALRQATLQARQNAEAIASGLGKNVGTVLVAEEGSSVRVTTIDGRLGAGAAATTPVEPGNVDVRASVAIEAELQ
jgi:uncharacterized protein YggE